MAQEFLELRGVDGVLAFFKRAECSPSSINLFALACACIAHMDDDGRRVLFRNYVVSSILHFVPTIMAHGNWQHSVAVMMGLQYTFAQFKPPLGHTFIVDDDHVMPLVIGLMKDGGGETVWGAELTGLRQVVATGLRLMMTRAHTIAESDCILEVVAYIKTLLEDGPAERRFDLDVLTFGLNALAGIADATRLRSQAVKLRADYVTVLDSIIARGPEINQVQLFVLPPVCDGKMQWFHPPHPRGPGWHLQWSHEWAVKLRPLFGA